MQYMRNVVAALKWRVQNNGIKPGLKDHWIQVEKIAADEVNDSRAFVLRSQDLEQEAIDFTIRDDGAGMLQFENVDQATRPGRWFQDCFHLAQTRKPYELLRDVGRRGKEARN